MNVFCARCKMLAAAVLLLGTAAAFSQTSSEVLPIVFVHGNGDDAAKWVGTTWLFESNGYPADKLYSIRFPLPAARTDDTREEPFRSSTIDATSDLSAFVTRVLLKTHSHKVILIGSSRGGMTIRNYIQNGGGRGNVAIAITAGTPNHGVNSSPTNLNSEFNGSGPYLHQLNQADGDGTEVIRGIRYLTLRSDRLDKYAQPTGIGLGLPQIQTGVTFDGPALNGATNVVLANLDHRELAFQPRAFAEMYRFITGKEPSTLKVISEATPKISGAITGTQGIAPTNLPIAGVRLQIFTVDRNQRIESSVPVYDSVTEANGRWGPVMIRSDEEYDFDLEYQGRHVHYYKAPIPRSSNLINLRFITTPSAGAKGEVAEAAGGEQHPKILITRPQGYFSSERDPVMIDGHVVPEEPHGLPIRDSFVAQVAAPEMVDVVLRSESIVVKPSLDFQKDLPVVDFLW